MTIDLSLEDLLTLAADLRVGPTWDVGLGTKAAVLLESSVRNHSLDDGNKRLGWLAAVVFYELNDVTIDPPDDDAHELVMSVARGEPTVEDIAAALRAWH